MTMPNAAIRGEPIRSDYAGMLLGARGFIAIFVALHQGDCLPWLCASNTTEFCHKKA
jgi:MFS transporter, DHA2 family, multidrug resistance protein